MRSKLKLLKSREEERRLNINFNRKHVYFLALFSKSYGQRKPGYYCQGGDNNKIRFGILEDHQDNF